MGHGKAMHGTGLVALCGALRRPALNTSVLISAFDVNVRELVPHWVVMPALMAWEPVM